jgi:glycosyltransferase involved in cell wall biosynthesis
MASGLPIACSRRRPMIDILGDAGVYFEPEVPASIGSAIRALLSDKQFIAELSVRAYTRAKEYSWDKCAAETFAFLESVNRKTS